MTVMFAVSSCVLVLTLASSPRTAGAARIDVPAHHPTIQEAVDAASPGDVVRVAPGVYQGPVRIRDGQTGLTIEAADPANPPTIAGIPNKSADGIRVDRVDGIVLRNLRIDGAYNGVRLNRVVGALLERLDITDSALGIRLNNGHANTIVATRVVGTRVEQGIWIDGSTDALVVDTVVSDTDEEGIAARNATGLVLLRTLVTSSRGSDAIRIHRSAGARVEGSMASTSHHDGLRVSDTPGLVLRNSTAHGNTSVGFRIEESLPIATVADVLAAGNSASGNGLADIRVKPRRCNAMRCETTSTTVPPSSTTTSTTIRPPTPTTTTLPPVPPAAATWRLYVRVVAAGGRARNVDVPAHGDVPIDVGLPAGILPAFAVGDRVSAEELAALGGPDLVSRFTAAAAAWLQARPDRYPGVSVVAVQWVQRSG